MLKRYKLDKVDFYIDENEETYLWQDGQFWHLVRRSIGFQEVLAILKPLFRLPVPEQAAFTIGTRKYLATAIEQKTGTHYYQAMPLDKLDLRLEQLSVEFQYLERPYKSLIFFYVLLNIRIKREWVYLTQCQGQLRLLVKREAFPKQKALYCGKDWYLYFPGYQNHLSEAILEQVKNDELLKIDVREELRLILGSVTIQNLIDWKTKLRQAIVQIDDKWAYIADDIYQRIRELVNFGEIDNRPDLSLPELIVSGLELEKVTTYYKPNYQGAWVKWNDWEFSDQGEILHQSEPYLVKIYKVSSNVIPAPFILVDRKKIRVDKLIWALFNGYSEFPPGHSIEPEDLDVSNVALNNLNVSLKIKKPPSPHKRNTVPQKKERKTKEIDKEKQARLRQRMGLVGPNKTGEEKVKTLTEEEEDERKRRCLMPKLGPAKKDSSTPSSLESLRAKKGPLTQQEKETLKALEFWYD